jgi:tungstate transport system ATP-binding protein
MSREAIAVRGLRVELGGRQVLDVPGFAVGEGEVMALVGPNGSGKSTLLQTLALLQPAARMEYFFAGAKAELSGQGLALRRQMAVVFQRPLLLNLRVFDNVALGLRLRRLPSAEVGQRVGFWLQKLGVSGLARRKAHALSGGEAQRVSLARALVLQPRLLFLDEPFGALDVLTRWALIRDLREVLGNTGVTTVFSTHDFLEVLLLADRVAVVDRGQIVQTGQPREVFRQPASDVVRDLIRAAEEMVRTLDRTRAGPG